MAYPSDPNHEHPSLPEDLARRAGLPRQEDISRSLHAGSGALGHDGGSTAASTEAAVAAAADRAERSAASGTQAAANAASDIRSTVSEAADRTRGRASESYGELKAWAADRFDEHGRRAADLADRGYVRLREGRTATEAFVSDNPLLVGVVGLAAGLLLGALLPRTRREDEALGPWADEVRDQGLRYAREMTHRGRAFVETALDPDNLDRAARQAGVVPDDADTRSYEGPERTAHRL